MLNNAQNHPPPVQVNQVIRCYNQGKFEHALAQGNDILKSYPLYHPIHNILGAVNSILGNKKQAINHFREAIKIQPNHSHAYNNLGVVLKSLGDYNEAQQMAEKAIKINPNYADAYKNLGDILKEKNLNEFAEKNYKIAKAIEGMNF